MVATPEPRAWAGVHASRFGIGPDPLSWLTPDEPDQAIRCEAAREQHVLARRYLNAARRRAREDGVSSPMQWLEARVRTMSYDAMWSVLRGRTWMALVHMRDFEAALDMEPPTN